YQLSQFPHERRPRFEQAAERQQEEYGHEVAVDQRLLAPKVQPEREQQVLREAAREGRRQVHTPCPVGRALPRATTERHSQYATHSARSPRVSSRNTSSNDGFCTCRSSNSLSSRWRS